MLPYFSSNRGDDGSNGGDDGSNGGKATPNLGFETEVLLLEKRVRAAIGLLCYLSYSHVRGASQQMHSTRLSLPSTRSIVSCLAVANDCGNGAHRLWAQRRHGRRHWLRSIANIGVGRRCWRIAGICSNSVSRLTTLAQSRWSECASS